ncbi:MAG: hypothetical protein O2917_02560 [Acidobacteria bacterium]|nr:hypothetical protein [Acidobacteriota bacterium]
MAMHLTVVDVARMALATQVRASRLSRHSSVLGWWHERKFVAAVDEFTRALRSLSQSEVEQASHEQLQEIGDKVDALVDQVEHFISSHGNGSLKRVERNRYLVTRIYELRASFEKVARRVTAQPGMTDLRWKVKLDTAHRDDT